MGTLNTWLFEGTPGATLADTGLSKQGAGTLVYASADAARGSTGARLTAADGNVLAVRLTAAASAMVMRTGGFVRARPAAPTATATLATMRNGTGVAFRSVQEATDGSLGWSDLTGTFRMILAAASVVPDAYYYADITCTVTSTSGQGTVTVTLYNLAGVQVGTSTLSGTASIGTAPITASDWGACTVFTPGMSVAVDYVRMEDGVTTPFGFPAASSNVPPTITGPSPLNITGPTGSITFQGNDTDGTISSFQCVHLGNTAPTTVTPTVGTGVVSNPGTDHAFVTFPLAGMTAGAQYRYGATDTDDDGAVSAQVVALVNVTSATPAIRPDVTTSGYTVVGGGTAAQALSAGLPSSRYLQSAAPAAGSTGSVPVEPLPPGAVPVFFFVTGHASDGVTALTRTVRLWQGATKIAEKVGTINPTTDSTIGRNTTDAETALITDRAALRVDWVVS
jgi:hypothetical protein